MAEQLHGYYTWGGDPHPITTYKSSVLGGPSSMYSFDQALFQQKKHLPLNKQTNRKGHAAFR